MMLTAGEFVERVGRKPEQDDLERANCELAGQIGHYGCGLCAHGLPVFLCHPCFYSRCQLAAARRTEPHKGREMNDDDDLYVTWFQLGMLCLGILIGSAIVMTAAWFAAKWFA